MYSKQCVLRNGRTFTVTYLPEEFAKKGKVLMLKDNGTWEDGWIVEKIGRRRETKKVLERSQDYKRTRKESDV